MKRGKAVSDFSSYGISPDYSKVSILKWTGGKGEVVILNSVGDTLTAYDTITMADKSSFGIYPLNAGNVILRDKIANFTFIDTFGNITHNMSNSSESKEGEAISELAVSPNAETVVIYNPKIKRKGKLGSQAVAKHSDGTFKTIFFSTDRYIKNVITSEDGDLIAIMTAAPGNDDKVFIMDKYGNDLNSISTSEELAGAVLSGNGKYITLYSAGRVMVYSTKNGSRLGSSSFRSPVYLADYFPEDHVILAMTGDYGRNILTDVEIKAINLKKRKITNEHLSGSLGFRKALTPRLTRISSNYYQLLGASKKLNIKADF
ncbi:MAG: hypothetical protein PVH63_11975 [Balneolaceae bacterium]